MTENLNFPPPSGPRLDGAPVELAVPPSTVRDPAPPPEGVWTAPPGPTTDRKSVAPIARANTAESLDLAIPELTGSVELDIPGAAVPVALTGLNGSTTKVLVNGRRVKPTGFSKVSIPMTDGTSQKIRIGGFSGYPVVKFKGKTVYRHPKPPAWEFALLCLTWVAPIFGMLGGIVPILIGFGSVYVHVQIIKGGANIWVRIFLPLIVAAGWIALGLALLRDAPW